MSNINFKGGPKRIIAYNKLKVFLSNPGKFSLMVLGSRGSGKHFSIETAFEELKSKLDTDYSLNTIRFISSLKVPSTDDELDDLFSHNQNGLLVIEDVEQLTIEKQELLFSITVFCKGIAIKLPSPLPE